MYWYFVWASVLIRANAIKTHESLCFVSDILFLPRENNSVMLDRSPRFGLTIQLAGVLCHARVAVVEVCGVSEIRAGGSADRPPC